MPTENPRSIQKDLGNPDPTRASGWERFIGLFTEIHAGEGRVAVLLLLNMFLLLTAYYFIKPVRDGWLAISPIGSLSKVEVRALSAFGQGMVLLVTLPLYARLARRLTRLRLVSNVNLLLAGMILLFYLLRPGFFSVAVPYVGVAFYLFVGIFAVLIVSQFWAFAADLYDEETGSRLFPFIAVGASTGAVLGAWISGRLVKSGVVDSYTLLLLALPLVLASILLTIYSDRLGPTGEGRIGQADQAGSAASPGAPGRASPYGLIWRHRYLTATAALVLIFTWLNTNGDTILYGAVQASLENAIQEEGVTDPAQVSKLVREGTTAFYGDLYFWVNLCGLLAQALLVSRILKFGGFGWLLLIPATVSLIGYGVMALIPLIGILKMIKITENSVNYSLNNTARHVLWLPTTHEMKFMAKPTIDTLFARAGDGIAALTVIFGARWLSMNFVDFFGLNVLLAMIWIAIGIFIVREHRKLTASPLAEAGSKES